MKLYKFTRKQLKTKRGKDFKEGNIIKVSKYFIEIHYGKPDPKSPHWNSLVYTKDSIADLKLYQIPQYIKDFLERR